MNVLRLLREHFRQALLALNISEPEQYLDLIRPTSDSRFGDYQANLAMPLGKALGRPPRTLAAEIIAHLALDEATEPPEIAGPGFINLRLRSDWLARQLLHVAPDDRLGVTAVSVPQTFVLDYSSPNVAKPMHVGHLRSTIIGDCLARTLRFLGHRVITDNHLGDWGTQFGMLIYGYKHYRDEQALRRDPVREMLRLYVLVREKIREAGNTAEEDEEEAANPVAEACRLETAKLHAGDPENLELWRRMMPWCLAELERIYRRLHIQFDYTLGESFYHPMLTEVVQDLLQRGIATYSEGAVVVFLNDQQPPAIIRKRDGAYTYMTTDLATVRYRMERFRPEAILYVVDFRQSLHFQQLFEIARRWGYKNVRLEHVSFGSVMGPDRKPIKTREGGAVELEALLDEAVRRARAIVDMNSPELPEDKRAQIAEVVGIGAVKYADLSQNRTSDYVFNWDKMLAMDGNTATYMQYAYARIRSVFRKGDICPEEIRRVQEMPRLSTPEERNLALWLLRLSEAIENAASEYRPNHITAYLWELANAYHAVYQNHPILKAPDETLRRSRLLLCDLTARTIKLGLGLLGIGTVEQM
ncbi:MAG: arginine--tRNA ligase [Gemmatales bacterium]|nr:arginine--tRNA ligase [Gemmatales bacterium]MCS7160977.1 arginine--tRNA ligase [Gemmatales bacterium]MDW8176180.1 arginine--tRNA ligase [Gemmatales bacterium]MDW8222767.1 arginine--tRNA ligase [Gemmatales bacterium]